MSKRAGLALALLVVALPFATWWIVGDRSRPGDPEDLDFLVRGPELTTVQQLLVGVPSTIIALLAARALHHEGQRGLVPARARWPIAVLLVLAVVVGVGVRIVTAGVTGANIGGAGLLLLSPVAGVVALAAVVRLWTLRAGQVGTATARV